MPKRSFEDLFDEAEAEMHDEFADSIGSAFQCGVEQWSKLPTALAAHKACMEKFKKTLANKCVVFALAFEH